MAYRSQPLKTGIAPSEFPDKTAPQWADGSMLGVRRLSDCGLILHTRKRFVPGSQLALSLQIPSGEGAGRGAASAFIHVQAMVAGLRVVKDSAIGRIYEVTLVFHPHSVEQQRWLGRIAGEFTHGSIAVPSERDARTGEPNPLFGLN